MIRSFTYCIVILTCVLVAMPSVAAVLVRGDGFVVDSSDVEAQKDFFSEKGFESTDAEHLNAVLKMQLFAFEAKNSGLVDSLPEPTGPYKNETVMEYNRLFQIYYQHLMETYTVSDDAILSYYLSYPEKFLLNDESPKGNIKKEDLWVLDGNIKNWIHSQIVLSKKAVIMEDEFKRLKNKYHVVFEK